MHLFSVFLMQCREDQTNYDLCILYLYVSLIVFDILIEFDKYVKYME